MAVDVGDVFEVTARAEFRGVEDVDNVFQYQYTSGSNSTNAIAIDNLLTIMETVYAIVRTFQHVLTLYRDLRVRNVTKGEVYGTFGWPSIVSGSVSGGDTPPGVAALINLSTGIPRVVLKKYWGGLDNQALDTDGTLTGAMITSLAAISAVLLTPQTVGSNTYVYGYLSPKTGNFESPQGSVITDIPAYQRRRKQGRGV